MRSNEEFFLHQTLSLELPHPNNQQLNYFSTQMFEKDPKNFCAPGRFYGVAQYHKVEVNLKAASLHVP